MIGAAISAATAAQEQEKTMPWLRNTSASVAAYLFLTMAQAAQVGSVEGGHRLAREMCAECHLLGAEAGTSNNANAPTFKEVANTPGMTGAALRSSFQSWHKDMPNLIITVEQEDNLVAYILSLRKSD